MTDALRSQGLGMRYGHRHALADCTLSIPAGHVVGLVGPNGAGKTTLLHLAVGLLTPASGTIEVLGGKPGSGPAQLAQDTPLYAGLTVADHLKLGAHLNPGWDMAVAAERIERLRLDPRQKAGKMSGGQRAQLALTMAIAKNPELLIMDEPIASLDPLARSDFLRSLADFTAARQVSVVLSSHLLGDLERICDYLIVLVGSRVQVAGEVSDLLASHRMLTGVRADPAIMPPGSTVISASRDGRPRMVLARVAGPVDETAWPGGPITLEDLVLAYMSRATDAPRRESALKGQS